MFKDTQKYSVLNNNLIWLFNNKGQSQVKES